MTRTICINFGQLVVRSLHIYDNVTIISSCHTLFNRIALLFQNGKYGSRSAGCCSVSIFASNVPSSDWKFVVVVKKFCIFFLYLITIHVTFDFEMKFIIANNASLAVQTAALILPSFM